MTAEIILHPRATSMREDPGDGPPLIVDADLWRPGKTSDNDSIADHGAGR
jgi:hypothetical protein